MFQSQKTIIISSFHPHISRNVFVSGVLDALLHSPDVRIVIVAPVYKVEYFQKTFGNERVLIEGVPLYQSSRRLRGRIFKRLAIYLFNTNSARLRKRYEYYLTKNRLRFVVEYVAGYVGNSSLVRRFNRFLDYHFSPKGFFKDIIEKYQPGVVVSTDVQNENDVSLLQDARRAGIRTVGMIRSWDNLSLRILRVFPDTLIVGSDTLKEEAVALNYFPRERISVTGNAHYDHYRARARSSRADFCKKFGLSEGKPFILYAPISDALVRVNDLDQYILKFLAGLKIPVVVRFPPEKKVELGDFKKPDWFVYDQPGEVFGKGEVGDREIRPEDDNNLLNELTHAAVVVTGPTSICLDSAFFDTPVIAVDIYPTERPFFEKIWRYKDYHIQKMLATKGVRYATSLEGLKKGIEAYLKDKTLNAEGRKTVRSMWFSHIDGNAAKRVAETILTEAVS